MMMTASRLRRATLVVTAALWVAAFSLVAPSGNATPTVSAQTTGLGAGGEFHALSPDRVFDSRLPEFGAAKRATSLNGSDFPVRLAGLGGLPTDTAGILAVVANVTVAEPTVGGWLAVRPTGAARKPIEQMSSLVNFAAGKDVPNLVVVGVGPDGSMTVTLRASAGGAHVIVDVLGWISKSGGPAGSRLVPVGPARLLDTRTGDGQWAWTPLAARTSRPIQIRGASTYQPSVPDLKDPSIGPQISAVLVNITAVNTRAGSQNTVLAASDAPLSEPTTSSVNLVRGQIKAGLAVVPVDGAGNIHLYNHGGETDVVVDIVGYFKPSGDPGPAGRIVPLDAPFRVLDTRLGAFGNVPLGAGSAEQWSFKGFADSVTMAGAVPVGAQSAFLGNVTATDIRRVHPAVPISSTYLTVYPPGPRPASSNLNLSEGEVVPNMSLVRYGPAGGDPNRAQVYNHDGSAHYVLDVYAVVLS